MEEIWKDIPGYDGVYQVSNLGRIRSVKIKASSFNNSGYKIISITKDGVLHHYLVHRLVASAFCENPRNCKTVNHLDENKLNNRADNLEWCTQAENNAYGTARKRSIETKSTPVVQLSLDGEVIARYSSAIAAEREAGYDHSTISKCCRGLQKQYRGYVWKFED